MAYMNIYTKLELILKEENNHVHVPLTEIWAIMCQSHYVFHFSHIKSKHVKHIKYLWDYWLYTSTGTRAPFGRSTWLDFYILSLIAPLFFEILCNEQFPRAAGAWWPQVRQRTGEDTALDTVLTHCDTVWHNLTKFDTLWHYLGWGPKPSADLVCLVTEIDVMSLCTERWRLEAWHWWHRWTGIESLL